MGWREARSLKVLWHEINDAFPGRDRRSDGSIGDAKHSARWESSDHNPWVEDDRGQGVVRARDFDEDGILAERIVQFILRLARAGAHPALGPGAYLIYEGRIWSHARGWVERKYSGSNAHLRHFHISVARAQAGFDSVTRWGVGSVNEKEPETPARTSKVTTPAAPARPAETSTYTEDEDSVILKSADKADPKQYISNLVCKRHISAAERATFASSGVRTVTVPADVLAKIPDCKCAAGAAGEVA